MKKYLTIAAFLSLFVGSMILAQQGPGKVVDADHADYTLVRPDAIKWGPPPPGLPPGSQAAVLVGDPGKPAPFVIRAKMPDGYKIPAHWHSIDESVTVISGTLRVGHGDKLDPADMEELTAGCFWHMPKGMRHYVMAKGETIVQINSVGPFDITYINPADDPRNDASKVMR